MASRFWVGGTGNFSDTAHWASATGGAGGASVPGSADTANFDANSGTAATVTVDTAATVNNLTHNKSDLTVSLAAPLAATLTHTLTTGLFKTNGFAWTAGAFSSSNSNTRSVDITNSLVTLTAGGSSNAWNISITTGLTLTTTGSTLLFTGASTGAAGMQLGGLGYQTVRLSGSGVWTLFGNNTITSLIVDPGETLQLRRSSIQTLGGITAIGSSGSPIALSSDLAGTAATIVVTTAQQSCDWLTVTDVIAKGGAQFFAGAHSTLSGITNGWRASAPDRTQGSALMAVT